MRIASLFLFSIFALGCASVPHHCLQRRGAIDIGSGSTKALAAEVDICEKKIVRTLYEHQIPLAFADAVARSPQGEIPDKFRDQAVKDIQPLLEAMKAHNLKRISALATSTFRTSKNGAEAALEMSERLNIPIHIVTQEQEAEIGAMSALSQKTLAPNTAFVVWDIGGGSMQMWTPGDDAPRLFKGDLASVSFKNKVIQTLQGKNPKRVSSPNPLGRHAPKAVELAATHARKEVPPIFKERAAAPWIGIGGVLAISVQKQIDKDAHGFSRAQLAQTLREKSALKDAQIESKYRETEVSNLALVLGYMEALGVDSVETVQASLTQGWLLR